MANSIMKSATDIIALSWIFSLNLPACSNSSIGLSLSSASENYHLSDSNKPEVCPMGITDHVF